MEGLLDLFNDALRSVVRAMNGKRSRPTASVIDSQTVRRDPHDGEVGYDAAKKTKGRKRFLCMDTLGLILNVVLVPAKTTEREGAKVLLDRELERNSWLRKIWADGGFQGSDFARWVKAHRPKPMAKSSGAATTLLASACCPNAGLSNGPLAGSPQTAVWFAIMKKPPAAPAPGFSWL